MRLPKTMTGSPLAVLLLAAPALAGCLGAGAPSASDPTPSEEVPLVGEVRRLAWEGHLLAGAAYEVPGHIEETSGPLRPAWSMSFQLHVEQPPEAMEVTLAWTAPLARLVLMVTEPFDRDHATWYETPPTDQSPVCVSVPASALRAGVWRVMAHSEAAVDAALSFEVAMTGGAATAVDEPSHAPAADFPLLVTEAETPAPPPCTGAAG